MTKPGAGDVAGEADEARVVGLERRRAGREDHGAVRPCRRRDGRCRRASSTGRAVVDVMLFLDRRARRPAHGMNRQGRHHVGEEEGAGDGGAAAGRAGQAGAENDEHGEGGNKRPGAAHCGGTPAIAPAGGRGKSTMFASSEPAGGAYGSQVRLQVCHWPIRGSNDGHGGQQEARPQGSGLDVNRRVRRAYFFCPSIISWGLTSRKVCHSVVKSLDSIVLPVDNE